MIALCQKWRRTMYHPEEDLLYSILLYRLYSIAARIEQTFLSKDEETSSAEQSPNNTQGGTSKYSLKVL